MYNGAHIVLYFVFVLYFGEKIFQKESPVWDSGQSVGDLDSSACCGIKFTR